MGGLGAFGWERLVVILLGRVGIEREVELVAPAEFEAAAAQRIVAQFGRRVALGQIGGVGGEFVGDHADFHVVAVGQAEVFLGGDVAQHRRAEPADHRRADAAGDVVVAGRDVGGERSERVERRFAAHLKLLGHILLDLVHRHMAGAFDHHLNIGFPRAVGEFAKCVKLGKLRFIIGVGD